MAITSAINDFFSSIYELLASVLGTFYAIIHSFITAILGFVQGIFNLVGDVVSGMADVVGGVDKFVAGTLPFSQTSTENLLTSPRRKSVLDCNRCRGRCGVRAIHATRPRCRDWKEDTVSSRDRVIKLPLSSGVLGGIKALEEKWMMVDVWQTSYL